jgi:hypothetical protein
MLEIYAPGMWLEFYVFDLEFGIYYLTYSWLTKTEASISLRNATET